MYCPNCNKHFDGKFCPECGTKLIEAPQQPSGFNVKLGDANAISGGLHLADSHNVSNIDSSVHNTSNVSNVTNNVTNVTTKSEMEILQEKKTLYLNACKLALEDNQLSQDEANELENYRIELDLDTATAKSILDSVYQMTMQHVSKTELTPVAKIKLKNLSEALKRNDVSVLMKQIDGLEALADRFDNEELQYKYYLTLAALKQEKCIKRKEASHVDKYWESFWSYLAYIKTRQQAKALEILDSLSYRFPQYPEDNIGLLGAAGALMLQNTDEAKDFLETVVGTYSNCLQRFAYSIYLILEPEIATDMGATEENCAFYSENFFNSNQKGIHPSAECQQKWKRMTEDGIEALKKADNLGDVYSALNLLIPPAFAGDSEAKNAVVSTMSKYGKEDVLKIFNNINR